MYINRIFAAVCSLCLQVQGYLIPEIGDVAAGSVEVLHLPGGDLVQRVQSHWLRLSAPQQSQLWSPTFRIKLLTRVMYNNGACKKLSEKINTYNWDAR
jgi:hypothetical protein